MTTTQPTKHPIDIQAEQMAEKLLDSIRPLVAEAVKPKLEQIHDQATQLTLAQCFASENEQLKQRVAELEVDSARLDAILEYVRGGRSLGPCSYWTRDDIDGLMDKSKDVAGECTRCGGVVLNRAGRPGEFDHVCAPNPTEPEAV